MIAGDDREAAALAQRRERLLEPRQLATATAVGQIAGDDDVVDACVDQRATETDRAAIALDAAAEVQIGDMRQLANASQHRGFSMQLLM